MVWGGRGGGGFRGRVWVGVFDLRCGFFLAIVAKVGGGGCEVVMVGC